MLIPVLLAALLGAPPAEKLYVMTLAKGQATAIIQRKRIVRAVSGWPGTVAGLSYWCWRSLNIDKDA